MDERSDRLLVRAARAGDRDAAGALFGRYWQSAWRVAYGVAGRRALADDVAADAFERAFAALPRFDEKRAFAPWLHRIVVNRALDLLRAERRLTGSEPLETIEAREPDAAGDVQLLEAVQALPLQRRAAVILRYGIGMSPEDIAVVLDVPVGTVHSRLARALDQLRDERKEAEDHVDRP
jgi:RNA polymerase sigma-70 factor (ECF subfamily)